MRAAVSRLPKYRSPGGALLALPAQVPSSPSLSRLTMLARPAPDDDLLNLPDVSVASDTVIYSPMLPASVSFTSLPTQPTMSGSRSLTTLIRDLHAEFADLTDIMNESFPPSMESDEEDEEDANLGLESPGASSDSSDGSISLVLDDLERLAVTVKALPIPRPPSLTKDEWQNALESPDPRFSGHFEDKMPKMPKRAKSGVSKKVFPRKSEPTIVQSVRVSPVAHARADGVVYRRSTSIW